MSLNISKDLSLPDEAVTQTFAILAKRGVGKTYTASVMVEEMLTNHLHVVIVDPIGVWYGLRTSANGKSPGFPVIVAGGEHGDVPLESTSGQLIANLIVDKGLSLVIDLSLMRKNEQKRFMVDFAETLYHKNRTALHLVLDEADEFAPQRPMANDARMLGAIEDLVRRGRARGIGVTLITQRPAVLNKNVLTQIEVLVAMRLTSPQDRSALNDWVKYHADAESSQEMITELPTLPVGTAWFWSPGWLDIFKKVAIRKRKTLDSSSTPKVGDQVVAHTKVAEVDIEDLRKQLAATIEKVESEDPKVLRRRIAELEKQLADRKPQVETREIEKEVIPPRLMGDIDDAVGEAQSVFDMLIKLRDYCKQYEPEVMPSIPTPLPKHAFTKGFGPAIPDGTRVNLVDGDIRLGPGELKILTAAGQYPEGITRSHLTVLTDYKRSSRNTYISRLIQAGLIKMSGDSVVITSAGVARLGDNYDPLPTGDALRQRLLSELPAGEKAILERLIEVYPDPLTRDEISELTGYLRSSRNTYLSRMTAREIIEVAGSEVRASDKLFVTQGVA